MDDLISEFIDETVESLSELDMDLVKLEQDPENEELLGKIFRLMHTIKGTCGFLGLPRLEKTAHAAENLLDLFRSGEMDVTQTSMTLLFMSIDRVRYLVSELEQNAKEPEGDDQDIISEIEAEIAQNAKGGGEASADLAAEAEALMNEGAALEDEAASNTKAKSEQNNATSEPEPDDTKNEEDTSETKSESEKETKPKPDIAKKSLKAPPEKSPEFLRVQMTVLEDLINMVSELVLTRNQLLQLIRLEEDSPASAPLQRLNRVVSDLQEGVMKTRMQPIGNAWSKLPRIVRDLSMELNKKINLDMQGEDTELDRQVLEMIKDPLTHMVRNSCDHGIETPEVRTAAGKPEAGTITLKAYHEGGFIIVEIVDDGKGLDGRKIGEKAVEKGLIEADKLENLTDKQLLQNIFKAGFSTADQVTNVSGRGVGMDVVRSNIEKIGGTIDMESKPGKGTGFKIQIPLTLAIISGLIVEIDGLRYAVPQLNIQELVRIQSDDDKEKIEKIDNRPVFRLRDKILPLIDSKTLFGTAAHLETLMDRAPDELKDVVSDIVQASQDISDDQEAHKKEEEMTNPSLENNAKEKQTPKKHIQFENKLIAVMNSGSSYFGLVVDAIHDMEEIVIKSISSVLQDTGIFAGNTILGDGQVIMILDPAGIARHFEVASNLGAPEANAKADADGNAEKLEERVAMLVFKAGSETPKAIPLALISRLQQFDIKQVTESGDKIVAKYDGDLMPLYFTDTDGQKLETDTVTTLVLADDVSDASMGLIIEEVIDIIEDTLDLTNSTARPGVMGTVTLDDMVVDVLDIAHYLHGSNEDFFSVQEHKNASFLDNGKPAVKDDRTNVLVVDDSPFFRNMLKPILASAGFNVTVSEDAVAAIELHDQGSMFDIILSDIEMPHMNGYEFVEKMRGDTSWKDLPFIAITSHTTPQDIEYGYSKGFTKYIGKFDKDELLRTVKNVLSTKTT